MDFYAIISLNNSVIAFMGKLDDFNKYVLFIVKLLLNLCVMS